VVEKGCAPCSVLSATAKLKSSHKAKTRTGGAAITTGLRQFALDSCRPIVPDHLSVVDSLAVNRRLAEPDLFDIECFKLQPADVLLVDLWFFYL
jgi:hypothetical protein